MEQATQLLETDLGLKFRKPAPCLNLQCWTSLEAVNLPEIGTARKLSVLRLRPKAEST